MYSITTFIQLTFKTQLIPTHLFELGFIINDVITPPHFSPQPKPEDVKLYGQKEKKKNNFEQSKTKQNKTKQKKKKLIISKKQKNKRNNY